MWKPEAFFFSIQLEFLPAAILGEHDPVGDYRLLGIQFAISDEPGAIMHDVGILAPLDNK